MSQLAFANQGEPLHLTAAATLQPGSIAPVNTLSLKNPSGGPMELLEVKWQMHGSAGTWFTGGAVGCKLDLGSIPLTNGFIPIWNFGPGRFLDTERVISSPPVESSIEFVWKLPRPLYIPPSAVVVPSLFHQGLLKNNVGMRISYECRTVSPDYSPPKLIPVPYVASWISKSIDGFSASIDSDQSTDLDLINATGEELNIYRFIGRFSTFVNSRTPYNQDLDWALASLLFRARMSDSKGNPIVRWPTPFRQIFSSPTRSWDVNFKLDPGQFITTYLDKIAPPAPFIAQPNTLIGQAFVSMVGWRNVKRDN